MNRKEERRAGGREECGDDSPALRTLLLALEYKSEGRMEGGRTPPKRGR